MTPMLATMSGTHIILLALVVLLLFGAQKIPQLMRSVGSGLSQFKQGLKEGQEALLHEAPPAPPRVPQETIPKSE